jgi:hypothetical protein
VKEDVLGLGPEQKFRNFAPAIVPRTLVDVKGRPKLTHDESGVSETTVNKL